jgi:hypothetical protein
MIVIASREVLRPHPIIGFIVREWGYARDHPTYDKESDNAEQEQLRPRRIGA